jgi:hypothetical protein
VHISKERNFYVMNRREGQTVGREWEIPSPRLVTLGVLVFIPIITAHGSIWQL